MTRPRRERPPDRTASVRRVAPRRRWRWGRRRSRQWRRPAWPSLSAAVGGTSERATSAGLARDRGRAELLVRDDKHGAVGGGDEPAGAVGCGARAERLTEIERCRRITRR